MPSRLITGQDILRYIHRSTDDEQAIPQLTNLEGGYVDIYKGEVVVNYSADNPALYIRVGAGTEESSVSDKLVRIGNILIGDTEPFLQDLNVDKTGLSWYDTSREHFFIYTSSGFTQITNGAATELISGVVRQATYAETILGREESAYVTPKKLRDWGDYYEYVPRKRGGTVVYVDSLGGDDSIENDGSDYRYPFLTLERALLETVRRGVSAIKMAAGEYFIDNQPGSTELEAILPPVYTDADSNPIGPVNGRILTGSILEVTVTGDKGSFVIEDVLVENLYKNQQVFFEKDGEFLGHALIDINENTVTVNPVPFRNLRGTVEEGCRLRVARLSSLNSPDSGLVIPKACVIKTDGLVTMRPKYVTYYDADDDVSRAYLLRVTHGCQLSGLVFKDHLVKSNQFMYSVLTNATSEDVQGGNVNVFNKGARALGISNTMAAADLTRDRAPWLQMNDCRLDSHYGVSLMTLGNSFYGDLKEIYLDNYVGVVTQEDPTAYQQVTELGEPIEEQLLLVGLENWVVKVENGEYFVLFNGGYTKYVPQFYVVAEGNPTTVNVGNHILFDDPHPPVLFNLVA